MGGAGPSPAPRWGWRCFGNRFGKAEASTASRSFRLRAGARLLPVRLVEVRSREQRVQVRLTTQRHWLKRAGHALLNHDLLSEAVIEHLHGVDAIPLHLIAAV